MKTKFLSGAKLSDEIYKLSNKAKDRAYVVSAYVGKGAYELLSENVKKVNDVKFIVNFSEKSIKSGATNPDGIKELKSLGTDVRSCDYLHGKLYLFDDAAVITSANLSRSAFEGNLEVGVYTNGPKTVNKIVKFFNRLWIKSDPISIEDIYKGQKIRENYKKLMKKRGVPDYESLIKTLKKKHKKTRKKWKKPLDFSSLEREEHIVININWNPHKFKRECSDSEKLTDDQLECCHEARRCYNESWDGCASATLFKDFEYATSRKAIKKGRIAFFIAPNPYINGDYYLVGFLTMKSVSPTGDMIWGKRRVYFFEGDPKRSVRFPHKGKKVIKFDRSLLKKLDNLVDFGNKPSSQNDARYIGVCLRRNPRYISVKDAKTILEECYAKTKNKIVKQIIEESF